MTSSESRHHKPHICLCFRFVLVKSKSKMMKNDFSLLSKNISIHSFCEQYFSDSGLSFLKLTLQFAFIHQLLFGLRWLCRLCCHQYHTLSTRNIVKREKSRFNIFIVCHAIMMNSLFNPILVFVHSFSMMAIFAHVFIVCATNFFSLALLTIQFNLFIIIFFKKFIMKLHKIVGGVFFSLILLFLRRL